MVLEDAWRYPKTINYNPSVAKKVAKPFKDVLPILVAC